MGVEQLPGLPIASFSANRRKASASHVPGLPGCWSQGETEEEALENIRDAIREYLGAVAESEPGSLVREVEIPLSSA